MKTTTGLILALCLTVLGWAFGMRAGESAPRAAGHWEGSIQLPSTRLEVRVDLEQSGGGAWSGTIDIPVQALREFKLGDVTVTGRSVSFRMPGIPGDPKFAGELDETGKTISGQFTQSGQAFPFRLERKAKTALAGQTPSRGVPGKGLAGHWQGSLKPLPVIELRLALEITNAPGGGSGGVMTSMDQGNAKIPISALTEKSGEVHLEVQSVGGVFDGKMNQDGSEISGDWKQGGNAMPLIFKRLEKAPPSLKRSQEPKKPLPYEEAEIEIETASAGVKLAGTLTVPRGRETYPAVLLISGSGPQDRDEAILGHRPFLVLADHLTRQGIAVLRCDDRGVGQSTGSFSKATDADFVEDALAAVAWLRRRGEVKDIGLIGHSEGGIVAPRVAVKSRDVAFIVLLAGVGVPTEQLLVRQAEDIARVMGAGDEMIARNVKMQREMFRLVAQEKDEEALKISLKKIAEEQVSGLTEAQRETLGISGGLVDRQISTLCSPWFRELLAYDPRATLKQVKCPVLALNGEKDLQVAAAENLAAIRESVQAGGNHRVKTTELPGLNHLFQRCTTGAVAEYSEIEETFNPGALKLISDWILETVGRAS